MNGAIEESGTPWTSPETSLQMWMEEREGAEEGGGRREVCWAESKSHSGLTCMHTLNLLFLWLDLKFGCICVVCLLCIFRATNVANNLL